MGKETLIIANQCLLFAVYINAVFFQEIIGEAKAHILRATAAVCPVKIIITLCYSGYRPYLGDVKINAIADFCHQALFSLKYIPAAQAEPPSAIRSSRKHLWLA